jgi:hypothetical protein
MRRLSYAGTFKNPFKASTIRAIEWLTAKVQLLRLIRSFEKSGAPHGAPFWPKAIRHMGIRIETPPEEIARIPATGPAGRGVEPPVGPGGRHGPGRDGQPRAVRLQDPDPVAPDRHPRGRRVHDPRPLPARGQRARAGPADAGRDDEAPEGRGGHHPVPGRQGRHVRRLVGPGGRGEWNVFTHKIVKSTGATILPIYFPGQNSRAFQIANQLSDTVRQGLLLYEIKRCLFKPTRPVIGEPIPAEELKKWEGNPRGFLAWLREHTLALTKQYEDKGAWGHGTAGLRDTGRCNVSSRDPGCL